MFTAYCYDSELVDENRALGIARNDITTCYEKKEKETKQRKKRRGV